LLTTQAGFWGEVVHTGVTATAGEQNLDALFDGRLEEWVNEGDAPWAVTLDLQQPYQVYEVSLRLRGRGAVTLAAPVAGGWESRAEEGPTDREEPRWVRLIVAEAREASRLWQITLSPGARVSEVYVWGDGPPGKPEPLYPVPKIFPVAFQSLPGADQTAFSDHIYWSWQRAVLARPGFRRLNAVWAPHDKWARLSAAPILPPVDTLNRPVRISMARNEYEGALVTLTSLRDVAGTPIHDSALLKEKQDRAQMVTVRLSEFHGPEPDRVRGTLRVAGTLRSQLFGTVVGPLFSADNRLGREWMVKYLTNGAEIADFPRVALPPCGSAVFWIEVQTEDAAPGEYVARLTCEPGPSVLIRVNVRPVTLPEPRVWVHAWQRGPVGTTTPFAHADLLERTVADKLSRGIRSFYDAPTPGSEAAEARRQKPDVYFHQAYLIPDYYVGSGWGNQRGVFDQLGDEDFQKCKEHVQKVVQQFQGLNVPFEQWYGELWDEPGDGNADFFEKCAGWVKQIDPRVQVYCNPAFPEEATNFRRLGRYADVFVPFWGNWFKGDEWLAERDARPRTVNAFYGVQGCNKSELPEELVGHYRIMPWHAFALGLNGWGFYSYFAPHQDPWEDVTPGQETDYQVVYPGPAGPVPTRQAEAFRDGWEDYRLLTLLRERGDAPARAAVAEALAAIPLGREPLTAGVDFEGLRLRLLEVAAGRVLQELNQ
jgi:hypothetical protein